MTDWGLAAYCSEVLRPAWLAYSETLNDPVRARETLEAALELAWRGGHSDRGAVLRAAIERLVPDEDRGDFGTMDSLAQNALITLLYALDDLDGEPEAEDSALVQLEEFADYVDQMQSPSGYIDTSNRTTPTMRMCASVLAAARALLAANADTAVAREAARADAQTLWAYVKTAAHL